MIKWIDPKLRLPPQGKKILYFDKGDIYVVQRFGDMWLPIPFHDSKYTFTYAPQLWAEFNFPEGFTGKQAALIDKELLDIDDFERKHPEEYLEFMKRKRKFWQTNKEEI